MNADIILDAFDEVEEETNENSHPEDCSCWSCHHEIGKI